MDKKLELTKPLHTLGGDDVTELVFAFDNIKAIDYRNISKVEARLRGNQDTFSVTALMSKKTTNEFRIATAWIAALKGTKGLCVDDIDNLDIRDFLELEQIGLFFIENVE